MAKQILMITRTDKVNPEEVDIINNTFKKDYHVLWIYGNVLDARILNCDAEDVDIEELKKMLKI